MARTVSKRHRSLDPLRVAVGVGASLPVLIVPMAMVSLVARSFRPFAGHQALSVEQFAWIWNDQVARESVSVTLIQAILAAVFVGVAGQWLGTRVGRHRSTLGRYEAIVLAPFFTPASVVGVMFRWTRFSELGALQTTLGWVCISVWYNLGFATLAVAARRREFPQVVDDHARLLGRLPVVERRFVRSTAKWCAALTFVLSISNLGTARALGATRSQSMELLMATRFQQQLDLSGATAIGIAHLALVLGAAWMLVGRQMSWRGAPASTVVTSRRFLTPLLVLLAFSVLPWVFGVRSLLKEAQDVTWSSLLDAWRSVEMMPATFHSIVLAAFAVGIVMLWSQALVWHSRTQGGFQWIIRLLSSWSWAPPLLVGIGLVVMSMNGPLDVRARAAGIVLAQVVAIAGLAVSRMWTLAEGAPPHLSDCEVLAGRSPWRRLLEVPMRSHRGEVTMILLICWLVAAGEYSLTVIIGMGAISTAPQALADLGARQYPAAHVAAGVFSMMWFSLSVVLLVWLGNLASSGRSGPRFRVG